MEFTQAFADAVRIEPFGGILTQGQVDGIQAIFNAAPNTLSVQQFAYILATAYWETAHTMQPVIETFNPAYDTVNPSVDEAIARLERAYRNGELSWVKQPYWRKDADGLSWLGRGYVQLTFKSNYTTAYRYTGIDCVSDPSRALDPTEAAVIMFNGMSNGWFTGKKLRDYFSVNQSADPVGARRIINGQDHAADIAKIYLQFSKALGA